MRGAVSPTHRFIASREYAASTGAIWKTAVPAHRNAFAPHTRFGRIHVDLISKIERLVPESGTLEADGLFVVGRHGMVCDANGVVLPDHSWFRGHVEQLSVPEGPHEVRRVPGRCLAITSDWATRNYAHFVADALPRIRLAEMTGSELSTFDRFIVDVPNPSCLAMLERLGITRGLMVEPRDGVALQPDVLVAATLPGVRRGMPGWAAEFLRERLGRRVSQTRRLYIPRSGRKPINDDALIDIARQHGFEIYRPEDDLAGQIETFASAAAVVGAHGAALVNLVFARPETRVLELVPTDHVFPYYLAISEAAGLHYGYLAGPSLAVRADNEIGPSASDFLVDAGEFRNALDVLVS